MKKLFTLMAGAFFCTAARAQNDSVQIKTDTVKPTVQNADTIRIGNIIIIKKVGQKNESGTKNTTVMVEKKRPRTLNNVSTNWGIVDIGFTNFIDKTDYGSATSKQYLLNKPGTNLPLNASDFKLRASKSVDVNIWFFMQRLNLVKHYVNLKYGLGLELNNYRFRSDISFKEAGVSPYNSGAGIQHSFIIRDTISFTKNKLAADYITVPLLLNFSSNPGDPKRGLSFSAGISAGYLYSQRNKQESKERGKQKNKGEYDLQQFKFSYIAELGLGPIKLYGSYVPNSIFANGLNMRAYTFGIRLSNW